MPVAPSGPIPWLALRPDPTFEVWTAGKEQTRERTRTPRIRCPHCAWKPPKSVRWMCDACPAPEGLLFGCGTLWHTFDTRGRCPGCKHQWRWTSCVACGRWSLHEAWYAQQD